MIGLPSIPLDSGWLCDYFEAEPDVYELAAESAVTALSAWSFDRRRAEGWAAWLERTFALEPTDECVRYLLLIDSAPQGMRIYVNGEHVADYQVGDDDPPFEVDVTDRVWLDTNRIAFRVDSGATGTFAGVRLQPAPCDEL